MVTKLIRKDPWSYVDAQGQEPTDPRGERLLVISAPGCGELLKGTGFKHGQTIETDLDGALHVLRKLHEHGLDVTLARMSTPFLQFREGMDLANAEAIRGVRVIYVVPVNWNELAGWERPPATAP